MTCFPCSKVAEFVPEKHVSETNKATDGNLRIQLIGFKGVAALIQGPRSTTLVVDGVLLHLQALGFNVFGVDFLVETTML